MAMMAESNARPPDEDLLGLWDTTLDDSSPLLLSSAEEDMAIFFYIDVRFHDV